MNTNDAQELKKRYESIATTLDYKTTACDYSLRELEIDTACNYIYDNCKVLDVGCGLGYAVIQYASRFQADVHGIDYAANMIAGAKELLQNNNPSLSGTVNFQEASVLELPYENNTFDVVTSSRCLMALLDWELQKKALQEIHRVLKSGGVLVLMEGTFEGLEKLNSAREKFQLDTIAADGKDRLFTAKFHEQELLDFCKPLYHLEHIQRFGMYYFLTRVVHPLLVAPEQPKYSNKINEIARQVAKFFPNFEDMGHLVAFIFTKRR
ncbi:Methyltransferase type 11 domain-containing protein [Tumidithrix helvetica PCC 7403]|uniref:class I SAM-dependent methyltransferase n=1 Tax=Tumidithrix helvetica TaxID=3457545 RepID=UPI003CC413D5